MKTSIAFILLASFACFAQDASDITTEIEVLHRDNNRKNDVRVETTYRGNTEVMVTVYRPNKDGVMALSSRTYFSNGKAVMVESDDDRDGRLKYITVFEPDKDGVEMFTREADGTVKPVSTLSLDAHKRLRALTEETYQKFQKSVEELKRLLEEKNAGR